MSKEIVIAPPPLDFRSEDVRKQFKDPHGSEANAAIARKAWDCRERQLRTLLQSLSDAGIEVKDGKVVDPWKRVEDGGKYPDPWDQVLIAGLDADGEKVVSNAIFESIEHWHHNGDIQGGITHWSHLPPAPKGDPSA